LPLYGQEAVDPSLREWNQNRGNAAGTSAVDVAPVRSPPQELWRHSFVELLSEPVSWGGVVYVAAREKRNRKLIAIHATSGERLCSSDLGRGPDRVQLAVWQGTVAVQEEKVLRTYQHKGSRLRYSRKVAGNWTMPPCVYRGLLLSVNDSELSCVDLARGKIVASLLTGSGRPAVDRGTQPGDATIATLSCDNRSGYAGEYLIVHLSYLNGVGSKEPGLTSGPMHYAAPLSDLCRRKAYVELVSMRITAGADDQGQAWYAHSPFGFRGQSAGDYHGVVLPDGNFDEGGLSTITSLPAVHRNQVFGFSDSGTLIRIDSDGRYAKLVDEEDLPAGGKPGPATIARDVIYLGNWAVELESHRVLWCLANLDAATPTIPVGDGLFVVGSASGELLGFGDASLTTSEPSLADQTEASFLRPDQGDGVILRDGTFVLGRPEKTVESEIALVIEGDRAQLQGEQFPVFAAWRNALSSVLWNSLEDDFEEFRSSGFPAECQRLLQELRQWDYPGSLLDQRERSLTGLAENSNANAKRRCEYLQRKEQEHRGKVLHTFLEGVDWLHERQLDLAASALLSLAYRILPEDEVVLPKAKELMSEAFPWKKQEAAPSLWLSWANELLPAGGVFVDVADPLRAQAFGSPWDEDTLIIKTRNLLLLSREDNPEIVGACVRNGEGAVRALQRLLPQDPQFADPRLLQVRIHKNREDYLNEKTPSGSFAMPWSAGYYSPMERVSRFYVDSDGSSEPLRRSLYKTLAHELTHQYISQRWIGSQSAGSSAATPGFWAVEGIARFVEDQFVEMGRRGGGFDDTTVPSLDAVSQVAELDKLFPLKTLLGWSHRDFATRLHDQEKAKVRLRNTIATLTLTDRSLFYEQAGSLAFFLMNQCGPEGRAAMTRYLRDHYLHRTKKEAWQALGFEDLDSLENKFEEFLEGLRGSSN
jgi:hypothetical protein